MKPLTLIRHEAASRLRQRFPLAPVLAVMWVITCAPVVARGQDWTSTAAPPVSAVPAAPAMTDRERMKPSDAPPATRDETAPSSAEDSPDAVEQPTPAPEDSSSAVPSEADSIPADSAAAAPEEADRGFRWNDATEQTLLFLGLQHGYAFTQPKTRRDLHGPFFRDYVRSVASIGKWGDGGKFFTNYVAHPMQGALLGHVWVQNDPKAKAVRFGRSQAYWRSRAQAFAWSAAWSTQFELGPVSQASIGNVGLHGKQTWVDIVVTPTLGTAWLVAEDALDRFVVRRIERRTDNRFVRIVARMLLNPTRSSANILGFERPWRRYR